MPKYVIERTIPGIGKSSTSDLSATAAKSLAVLRDLGPDVQWVESFVTGDKVYCVYNAKGPEIIREHARRTGFPTDSIAEVRAVIDPTTADPTS
jgi:hypothetical protein